MGYVYLKESYYGASGYYADDIAIIVLQTQVTISNVVLPVCIDWSKQYSIPNGSNGKVILLNVLVNYVELFEHILKNKKINSQTNQLTKLKENYIKHLIVKPIYLPLPPRHKISKKLYYI